jgi:iron complex transport system substrate-binding protein
MALKFRVVFPVLFVMGFFHHSYPQQKQLLLTDDLGRSVPVLRPIARIISLAPNITEILYALNADSILAGVTDYCDYPPEAKLKPHMGGMINPNVETIVGAHPDMVLMSVEGNSRLDFEKLEKLSIPVFATNPRNFSGVMKSIRDIGIIAGVSQQADHIIANLQSRRDSIAHRYDKGPHPRILIVFSLTPLMVAGGTSFVNELISDAGGINLGAMGKGSYPIFSREEILNLQPDEIILTSDIAVSITILLKQFPEWRTLNAVRHDAVTSIDASLISRPGPRVIEGLVALAKIIHR